MVGAFFLAPKMVYDATPGDTTQASADEFYKDRPTCFGWDMRLQSSHPIPGQRFQNLCIGILSYPKGASAGI
jgi:Zn-dependent protease with chaperone function